MYEFNPWASLLPDLAAETLEDPGAVFPSIAGGSPGFFEDIAHIGGSAIGSTLNPALTWIGGQTSGVVREVWGAVEAALHGVAWWQYRLLYGAFDGVVNTPPIIRFFHPESTKFLSSHWHLSETVRMMSFVTNMMMNGVAGWIRDRTGELLGFAARGFGDLASAVYGRIDSAVTWAVNFTAGGLGYAARGFGDLASAVYHRIDSAVTWVVDRAWAGMGFAARGFGDLASAVYGRIDSAVTWVVDRAWAGMGFAARGFGDLASAVYGRIDSAVTWVVQRIIDGMGFAARGFGTMADFVAGELSKHFNWLYNNLVVPVFAEFRKIPGYVMAGGEAIFNTLVDGLNTVILGPVNDMIDIVNYKLAIPGKLINGQYRDLRAFLEDLVDPPPAILGTLVGSLVMPLAMAGIIAVVVGQLIIPLAEPERQQIERGVGAQLMTDVDIYDAWNRGALSEAAAIDQLQRRGFAGDRLAAKRALRFRLPPLTDLTRMAVREVFDPSQRQALTLDADYPQDLTGHARAIGLDEVWARNYWAAHWDLPSPTQGYEMLHRGIISEPQTRRVAPGA